MAPFFPSLEDYNIDRKSTRLNSSAIYLIVADIIRTFCLLCGHFYDHHWHFEYGPLLEFVTVETNMVLIYILMSWCMV